MADRELREANGASASRHASPAEERAHTNATHIVVRCDARGTWMVNVDGKPVSEHADETAAEQAARRHARRIGDDSVIVRDRYHRAHAVGVSAAGGTADDPDRPR